MQFFGSVRLASSCGAKHKHFEGPENVIALMLILETRLPMQPACTWTYALVLGTTRSTLSPPHRFEVAAMKGVMPIADPARYNIPWGTMNQTASPS